MDGADEESNVQDLQVSQPEQEFEGEREQSSVDEHDSKSVQGTKRKYSEYCPTFDSSSNASSNTSEEDVYTYPRDSQMKQDLEAFSAMENRTLPYLKAFFEPRYLRNLKRIGAYKTNALIKIIKADKNEEISLPTNEIDQESSNHSSVLNSDSDDEETLPLDEEQLLESQTTIFSSTDLANTNEMPDQTAELPSE